MARVLCTFFSRQTLKTVIGKPDTTAMPDSNIIQIDRHMFETRLGRLVTEKMTEILSAMLDAEADEITGAARYERNGGRKAYRAGHYDRTLTAEAGRLELKAPKLKGAIFESAVIERYRGRGQSVEEALIGMYLAGVGTRRVDDTGQLLWGDRMPSRTLSGKLKKVYGDIDLWRTRPLRGEYPYVFMDGVWHKLMGRACGERRRAGRHRRRQGGPQGGHRRHGGHEGGQGQLGAVRQRHDRTGSEGRAPGGRRPVRGTGLHGGLDAAGRQIPAVHGAFHAQRALQDAADPQGMGVRGPEGGVRHGKPGDGPRQGRTGRRGDGVQEAEGRGELPAGGGRGDDRVPAGRVPGRAPQEDTHQQHDRTAQQGDPAPHARRGRLPRRRQRAHARLRAHQIRDRERMEHAPLSRHVPAR